MIILPCSHLGDLTKSERYINAEKALKANPNIQKGCRSFAWWFCSIRATENLSWLEI